MPDVESESCVLSFPSSGASAEGCRTYFTLKSKTRDATEYSHPSRTLLAESSAVSILEGSYEGVRNLWRVEVEPQTLRWIAGPERLTSDPGPDTEIAISPDGKKLAYTIRTERTRIWSLPFKASTGRVTGTG